MRWLKGWLGRAREETVVRDSRPQFVPKAPEATLAWRPWNLGDVIQNLYEVADVHQSGGMGLVYRVRHRYWGQDLALKCPRPQYFQTEAHKQNFVRECETWVNLGLHPNVVTCYYVRLIDGIPGIFEEYVDGGSLAEWIDTGRLYEMRQSEAVERVLDIAIQAAWGLHFAHQHGVVHQDVKPANVLLTSDGIAKITDFGVARARAAQPEATTAAPGVDLIVTSGGLTPAYCSPEQASRRRVSLKTDIWSWAVSVLEMLTGGVFWASGVSAPDVLSELSRGRGPRSALPLERPIEQVLRPCLSPDPQRRPADMLHTAAALEDAFKTLTGKHYTRPRPPMIDLLAGNLNNRALSFLDLDREHDAFEAWKEALKIDPYHPESTYNCGLALWRRGVLTDRGVLARLEPVLKSDSGWLPHYLVAQIHRERGDTDAAQQALKVGLGRFPEQLELHQSLEAHRGPDHWGKRLNVFSGHEAEVTAGVIGPKGDLALSGSKDFTVRLWDLHSGKCNLTLKDHTDPIHAVCFSGDGRYGFSAGGGDIHWRTNDNAIRVWDLNTGECLQRLVGHTERVRCLSVSSDGRQIISAGDDKTVRLWDLRTGDCMRSLSGQSGNVAAVSFCRDGRHALSAGDQSVRVWDLVTGTPIQILTGHTRDVESLSLSPDGQYALTASADEIRLWEVATGSWLQTAIGSGMSFRAAYLTTVSGLVFGATFDTIQLLDLVNKRCLWTFPAGKTFAMNLDTAEKRHRALCSNDSSLVLWALPDLAAGVQAPLAFSRIRSAAESLSTAALFRARLERARQSLRDGRREDAREQLLQAKAISGYERDASLHEAWSQLGRKARRVGLKSIYPGHYFRGHRDSVHCLDISPDARLALSGSADKTLRLWDVATGQCLRVLEGHTNTILAICMSPSARAAISSSIDGTVRVWDLDAGQCARVIEGHEGSIDALCLSRCGRFGLSADDQTIQIWHLESGRRLRQLKGHSSPVRALWISPDGRVLLSGSGDLIGGDRDCTIRLWDLTSGQCRRVFSGLTSGVTSVSMTPDCSRVIAGSWHTIKAWDIATRSCIREWPSLSSGLDLSPDGRFLITPGFIWDLQDPSPSPIVFESSGPVRVAPDGRSAITGEQADPALRLWRFEWEWTFPEETDWNDGAEPYLYFFLVRHLGGPSPLEGIRSLIGEPEWSEDDFIGLLSELELRGFGWLRPDGVRRRLEQMKKDRAYLEDE